MFWCLHNVTLNHCVSESAIWLCGRAQWFLEHIMVEISLCYSFNDTFSQRNMCNLQMRSCLLLVLIAVVSVEILFAGQEYRTRGVRSEWLLFIFSISIVRVTLQTPVNNQVLAKGVYGSPKAFIKAVAISVCTEVVIWTKSYCCWLHPWRNRRRQRV